MDEALAALAILSPTPVQRQAIPLILGGSDVLASARTGSGKTAAFALPILRALSRDPFGVCAVVMEPSRELAVQVADQFRAFGAPIGIRVEVIVGGLDAMKQAEALRRRPHVIVATPGRLASLLRPGSDEARAVRRVAYLVLDEADRLLETSMAPALSAIVAALPAPERRQTLLFTATASGLPREAAELNALSGMPLVRDGGAPTLRVAECVTDDRKTASRLLQQYVMAPSAAKMAVFEQLLLMHGPEPEEGTPAGKARQEMEERVATAARRRERAEAARAPTFMDGRKAREAAAARRRDDEEESDDGEDEDDDEAAGGELVAGSDDEDADEDGLAAGPEAGSGSDEDESSDGEESDEDDDAGSDGAGSEEEQADASAPGGEDDDESGVQLRTKACIVFCGTVRECQLVSESLRELGWITDALHSAAGQRKRLAALAKFRSGLVPILVATDVAARGLDIPEVGLVVNWDLPRVAEDYVHRVGRTARASRGGRAVSIVTERDVALVHACEKYAGVKLTQLPALDLDAAHKRLNRVAQAVTVARLRLVESGLEERVSHERSRRQEAKGRAAK